MLSQARYEGEASMAKTAHATAKTNEAAAAHGAAHAHFATAARHVRLHARWNYIAAAERQMARQPPKPDRVGALFGVSNTAIDRAELERRADESAQIAANHKAAAERRGEAGFVAAASAKKLGGDGAPAIPPVERQTTQDSAPRRRNNQAAGAEEVQSLG